MGVAVLCRLLLRRPLSRGRSADIPARWVRASGVGDRRNAIPHHRAAVRRGAASAAPIPPLRCSPPLLRHSDDGQPPQISRRPPPKAESAEEKAKAHDADDWRRRVPNALTATRIAGAPIAALLVHGGEYASASALLVALAATDWLDGRLARRWRAQSALGAVLDPLADKTLVNALLCALAVGHAVSPATAAVVLARDAALVAGAVYVRTRQLSTTRPPPAAAATWRDFFDLQSRPLKVRVLRVSKLATALQFSLVVYGVIYSAHIGWSDEGAMLALETAVVATTGASGGAYALAFVRRRRAGAAFDVLG